MISVFAPGTLVAAIFCMLGWSYLSIRNLCGYRYWFAIACFFSSLGYCFAFAQYIDLFYIKRTPQADSVMWFLFLRMLCHCTTVLIFGYHYKSTIGRR